MTFSAKFTSGADIKYMVRGTRIAAIRNKYRGVLGSDLLNFHVKKMPTPIDNHAK